MADKPHEPQPTTLPPLDTSAARKPVKVTRVAETGRSTSHEDVPLPSDVIRSIRYRTVAAYTALGYSYIEWIEVLEGLEFGDLQAFLDGYWRPGRIRAVSFGDTTDALALEARDHLVRHAAVEETDDVHAHNTVRWYPEGVSRTHEVAVEHDDSAVWIMYLGPPGALSDARWTLLADLLSQPFYHNLRTKPAGHVFASCARH